MAGDAWPAAADHGTTGCCSRFALLGYGASRKGQSVATLSGEEPEVTAERYL